MKQTAKQSDEMQFVEQYFEEYYDNFGYWSMEEFGKEYSECFPGNRQRREWGFIPLPSVGEYEEDERPPLYRHKSLDEYENDVEKLFRSVTPRDLYYSTSVYRDPGNEKMDEKKRLQTDLVFDIDADIESRSYEDAIERSKIELRKLIAILRDHIGFEEDDMNVYFSGGKGYHLHIRDGFDLLEASTESREEIVGYITGESLDLESISAPRNDGGFDFEKDGEVQFVKPNGWGSMVLNSMQMRIDRRNEHLTMLLKDKGTLDAADEFGLMKDGGYFTGSESERLYKNELYDLIDVYAPTIDEPVTTDLHRLIRMPLSLHGGTGFRVTPVDIDSIDEFDPFSDAIPSYLPSVDVQVRIKDGIDVDSISSPPIEGERLSDVGEDREAILSPHNALFHVLKGNVELVDSPNVF
jgi:DNA primase small subunit